MNVLNRCSFLGLQKLVATSAQSHHICQVDMFPVIKFMEGLKNKNLTQEPKFKLMSIFVYFLFF